MPSGLVVLGLLLLLCARAQAFGILPGNSLNHQEITERAILDMTVQVCRSLAQAEGTDFTAPAAPFTADSVATACGAPKSSKSFRQAITDITLRNIRIDLRHAFNGSFHFDEEMFIQGRKIITEGLLAVKASNKEGNFETAREKLGEICHPLQDFYSHSNWVELGNTVPNSNLIRSDTSIGNIAAESRETCRSCIGDDCRNNILEDIIQEKVLTSGYFGVVPLVSTKPKGKCSHGGAVDQTSNINPKGGINKDTFDASHGFLHQQAADVAIAATIQLLEEIRSAAGDRPFLEMSGISKRSSKALCFLIDTTQSMSDDIEVVKSAANSIINSEVGTENEPSVYILVPFNDPDFGPLIKTSDPEVFKTVISSLSASGGGDKAEMSLSALQLALANVPVNSELFLFTDAPAKDETLKNTVIALIERTQSVVNFFISGSTVDNRRRRREANQQRHSRIAESEAQLYKDLAQASGGQAVEVTTSELPEAISLITESTSTTLVTLLQAARDPGVNDDFTFTVDDTVTDVRVHITGRSVTFALISPTGESQQSTDTSGSLITASRSAGNLITLELKKQAGQWQLKMISTNSYTLKVIGQSPIDFLFNFVEEAQGPFQGFDSLETRPRAGVNASLLVSLTGSDSATVTEVALVELLRSEEIVGSVEPQGDGDFLVHVTRLPSAEFVVRVKGQNNAVTNGNFQRQTSTRFRSSNLTISADSNSILEPGTPFSVPFSVRTYDAVGNLTIRATNSRLFNLTFPAHLYVEAGNSTNGSVTLSVPINTPSGTDVTLTIEAEDPGTGDTNYVVLRSSIVNAVTDFTPPVCQLLSLESSCSENCSSNTWKLSIRVTDEGTGVERVGLKQGNGTINSSPDSANENIMLVSYNSTCCTPDMELQVVDRVGNVGSCYYSLTGNTPAPLSHATKVTQSPFLCLITMLLGLKMTEMGSMLLLQ